MENLDIIIATSIAIILFAIFITATLKEFSKINEQEEKRAGR
jgi:ABC-type proline/glycine betaine transport system permease subunit